LRIQWDNSWPDLASKKRNRCLFSGAGATHLLGKKRKPKKRLAKRWEIESETSITIHNKMSLNLQWFSHNMSNPSVLGLAAMLDLRLVLAWPKHLGLATMPDPCVFFKKIYRNSLIVVLKTYLFCIFIFVFLTKYIFIFSIFLSSIFGH
jgi:hypothetical protein